MYMTTEPSRTELTKEQKLAAERFGKKDIKGFAPWQSKQTNTGAHAKKAASPSSRILPLDGLRALAIIGVIFYHTRPSLLSGGFFGRYLVLCTRRLLCYPEHGARTQGYRLV